MPRFAMRSLVVRSDIPQHGRYDLVRMRTRDVHKPRQPYDSRMVKAQFHRHDLEVAIVVD